jgi:hypothetical protein
MVIAEINMGWKYFNVILLPDIVTGINIFLDVKLCNSTVLQLNWYNP